MIVPPRAATGVTQQRPAGAPAVLPSRPPFLLQDEELRTNVARKFSFYIVLVLIFLKVSTIHEILMSLIGMRVPVMYFVVPPALIGLVLSGGAKRALRDRVSWIWLLFAVWLAIATVFSTWVGGSASAVFRYYRDSLTILFLVAGTVITWKECRSLMHCIGLAALVPLAYSLVFGFDERRVSFDFEGTIANANDLAAHLLLFASILLFMVLRPHGSTTIRVAAAAVAMVNLYVILRTASRGALVGFVAAIVLFLWRSSGKQRAVAAVLMPTCLVVGLLMLPTATYRRLFTFGSAASDTAIQEAAQSANEREYLLQKSIEYTFAFPLFGVGPHQFSNYEGRSATESGTRGNWHVTHNSYTQVSSETGLPGGAMFLAIIALTFGLFRNVARRARAAGEAEIAAAANCMIVGFGAFCVVVTFLSMAFRFYFPLMTGMALSFSYALDRELYERARMRAFANASPMR